MLYEEHYEARIRGFIIMEEHMQFRRHIFRVSMFLALIGLTAGWNNIPLWQPLSFVVDDPTDAPDSFAGDGICSTGTGTCTLRAAIMETNISPGPDQINLPPDTYFLSTLGANEDDALTGDLDITEDLTIQGYGSLNTIIDGGGMNVNDRIFDIDPTGVSIDVAISGVTIYNGYADEGAGIRNNADNLALTNVIIHGNNAINKGGGIDNKGTMTLNGVTLDRNMTDGRGGGIHNEGKVDIQNDSAITSNTAGDAGGGIDNEYGAVTITASIVSNNFATYFGGGIFNFGDLFVTYTPIEGNIAERSDGGGIDNGGQATVSNLTISSNSAGGSGGGINVGCGGTLIALNSTLSGNSAAVNGGGGRFCGAAFMSFVTIADNTGGGIESAGLSGPTHIKNSIVAMQASGGNCSDTGGHGFDARGGLNFADDSTCGVAFTSTTHPLIGLLMRNGGSTATHALVPSSPAIDASPDCYTADWTPWGILSVLVDIDQRGVNRPQGSYCDIGAYES
jgi:hypothetical protein